MPRRRPGTLFPLELAVLDAGLLLQASHRELYGFALAKQISDGDGGQGLTGHGTLYKSLSRMTSAGLLESWWEDSAIAEESGRPRRRLYRITGAGERAWQAEQAEQAEQAAAAEFRPELVHAPGVFLA